MESRNELVQRWYSPIVERWERELGLDRWNEQISTLASLRQPRIQRHALDRLRNVEDWLFHIRWPQFPLSEPLCPELDDAFENFRAVLEALLRVFERHSKDDGEWIVTIKDYRYGPDEHWTSPRDEDRHIDLVLSLVFELQLAVNLVCRRVREHVDAAFLPGFLAVVEDWRWLVPEEYSEFETGRPFTSLAEFRRRPFLKRRRARS